MTIDKEKILSKEFNCVEFQHEKISYHVGDTEMSRFTSQNNILAMKIAKIKVDYEEENAYSAMKAYEQLEECCQISISTFKSTISGKIKTTRNFLYKLAVGLKMSLEQANELFAICGGPLTEQCMADYICMKALEDKDDIYHFIDQFQQYTNIKIELRERKSSK